MINICIVCGKTFSAKAWNQTTCSEECKKKRQYQCWLKHKKKKEEQTKLEEKKWKPLKQQLTATKSKVTTQRGDPTWVKDYAKGDRLTQIAMLARALTDYGIINITYGTLSTKWDTQKYYYWENIVISRKRKEKAYDNKQHIKDIQAAAEEGTFKSENRAFSIRKSQGKKES